MTSTPVRWRNGSLLLLRVRAAEAVAIGIGLVVVTRVAANMPPADMKWCPLIARNTPFSRDHRKIGSKRRHEPAQLAAAIFVGIMAALVILISYHGVWL